MNSAAACGYSLREEIDQNIAGLRYIPARGDSPGQRSRLMSWPVAVLSAGSWLVHQEPSAARFCAVSDPSTPPAWDSTLSAGGEVPPVSRSATMVVHQSTRVWRVKPTSPSALNSASPRWRAKISRLVSLNPRSCTPNTWPPPAALTCWLSWTICSQVQVASSGAATPVSANTLGLASRAKAFTPVGMA